MSFIKNNIKSILLVILGASILAFGTYNFNLQNNITEGGVLGLLLFFENVFGISPSITSLCIDVSLFLMGMKFFGKKFLALSLLSTTTFATFYRIIESFDPVFAMFETPIIGSLLAGSFVGIGVGLVVLAGGAACGDDVIALVVSRYTPLKVNHVYMISDLLVLLLSLTYINVDRIFYSLIAVLISGKLISLIYYLNNEKDVKTQSIISQ